MRVLDRAGRGYVALATAALLAGCNSTIEGRPTALPTPSGPAETAAPPTSSAPSAAPAPAPGPADAIPLQPDENGYVFIETKSGRTRCQISSQQVDCEAQFTNTPLKDGEHANGVSVSSDGTVQWVLGNLGNIPVVTIDYLTYRAEGWQIKAGIAGTRFTNDRTGHGMFVSIDNVETF